MRTGTIGRIIEKSGDQGTFSRVSIMAPQSIDVVSFQCVFGELPWRDDTADLSCLPPAPGGSPITWLLKYQWSQEHQKNNYRVQGILNPDGTISKDVMPDFLHPSAKGFEIWSQAMEPVLAEMVRPSKPLP